MGTDVTPATEGLIPPGTDEFLALMPDAWPRWRGVFLLSLREHGVIRYAAEAAKISREYVYRARKADALFAELWEAALEDGTDQLVQEARARAIGGSDKLLMFLLKSHRPALYGDKAKLDVTLNMPETLAGALIEMEAQEAEFTVHDEEPDEGDDE